MENFIFSGVSIIKSLYISDFLFCSSCAKNCHVKLDPTARLKLLGKCINCEGQNTKDMIYEWQVHEKKKGETEFVDITNSIRDRVSTDMDIDKNFVSLPDCFTPGKTDFSKEEFF